MDAVDASLGELAGRYRFNERLLRMETEGFDATDWDAPPGPKGGNPARWILGHVTLYRRAIARRVGDAIPEEPWETIVAPGKGKMATTTGLPAAADLVARFAAAGERLTARLSALAAADAAKEWGPSTLPIGGNTVREGVHFLYFHETYHLGQIGLIRRIRGKPGFA